jgi:hypothetical protein
MIGSTAGQTGHGPHRIISPELKGKGYIDGLRVDGIAILKWNLVDLSGSGQGSLAGSCEHGNKPTGYIKGGVSN